MAKPKKPTLTQALKVLEGYGYIARPKYSYVLKGFRFQEDVLKRFIQLVTRLGLKQQDAATEALALWIEKHQQDKPSG